VPPGVVTAMATRPPSCAAGVLAVIEVSLITTTLVAGWPPNLTDVAPVNPVPVMVTLVPPDGGPAVGATLLTTGAASSSGSPISGSRVLTRVADTGTARLKSGRYQPRGFHSPPAMGCAAAASLRAMDLDFWVSANRPDRSSVIRVLRNAATAQARLAVMVRNSAMEARHRALQTTAVSRLGRRGGSKCCTSSNPFDQDAG
jgi:hypothetical protein